MASRSLGTLTVDLIAKVGGFTQGMTEAERVADRKTREMQRKMEARRKEITKAWDGMGKALAAGFAGISFGAVLGKVVTESKNAEREQALLAAALKATGSQAGYSQARLNELVGVMEELTGIAGGEFNQAQTVLLGFTNIVGEQLPKALQAAADFSVRTGASMASAAETIGRALDVPSAGMASLAKQGFKFSESQIEAAQKLERTGRIAEAQQVVLEALNETYGGAAVAARDTFGGALQALQGTINSLLTGDSGSLEGAKNAINDLTRTLSSEETRQAFATFTSWMASMAAQTIQTAATLNDAGLWGWLSVSNKESNDLQATYAEVSSILLKLKKDRDALDPSKSTRNKINEFLSGDVADLDRQIGVLEGKLKGVQSRLNQNAFSGRLTLDPSISPDLTPRTVGAVNLKDGSKPKGGKTQAEKDADAAKNFLQSMRDQVFKTQERTAWEQLHFDIQNKGLKLSEKQLGEAQSLATQADLRAEAAKKLSAQLDRQNTLYQLQERLMGAQQRHQLEMLTYGMGDQAAQELRERIALQEQQQAELRQMQHEHGQEMRQAETESEKLHLQSLFEERQRLTQEALAEELRLFDDAARQKQVKEKDWLSGAKAGMDTYARDAGNAYEQSKRVAQNTLQSMEDAGVSMAMNTKVNFGDMARSIIADLIRIQVRAQLAGLFSRVFGVPQLASSGITVGGVDGMNGYAGGGYTGPGGKYDPAGIVHRGEGVLSQDDMAAMGGPRAFEAFRASLHRGYAGGGVVGSAATVAAATGGAGVELHVHNNTGAQIQHRQRTGPSGKAIVDVFINEAADQVLSGTGVLGRAMNQRDKNRG